MSRGHVVYIPVKQRPRILATGVWTRGAAVDDEAAMKGTETSVAALPRDCVASHCGAGAVLQVRNEHPLDQAKHRMVTVALSKEETMQLACELLDALEESEVALKHRGDDRGA